MVNLQLLFIIAIATNTMAINFQGKSPGILESIKKPTITNKEDNKYLSSNDLSEAGEKRNSELEGEKDSYNIGDRQIEKQESQLYNIMRKQKPELINNDPSLSIPKDNKLDIKDKKERKGFFNWLFKRKPKKSKDEIDSVKVEAYSEELSNFLKHISEQVTKEAEYLFDLMGMASIPKFTQIEVDQKIFFYADKKMWKPINKNEPIRIYFRGRVPVGDPWRVHLSMGYTENMASSGNKEFYLAVFDGLHAKRIQSVFSDVYFKKSVVNLSSEEKVVATDYRDSLWRKFSLVIDHNKGELRAELENPNKEKKIVTIIDSVDLFNTYLDKKLTKKSQNFKKLSSKILTQSCPLCDKFEAIDEAITFSRNMFIGYREANKSRLFSWIKTKIFRIRKIDPVDSKLAKQKASILENEWVPLKVTPKVPLAQTFVPIQSMKFIVAAEKGGVVSIMEKNKIPIQVYSFRFSKPLPQVFLLSPFVRRTILRIDCDPENGCSISPTMTLH